MDRATGGRVQGAGRWRDHRSAGHADRHECHCRPATSATGRGHVTDPQELNGPVLSASDLHVAFGERAVLTGVDLDVPPRSVVAIIGPSGGGKTTLLRTFNRMNDLVPGARVSGSVRFQGVDLYAPHVDPAEVRRRIGMVFQQPTPFPKSVFENVSFGVRIAGEHEDVDHAVVEALKAAGLWDEVSDSLSRSALDLSLGQQQRLCIARSLAIAPEVLLMDEPTSALDPIATRRVEELIRTLSDRYAIVVVTHNLQQAARLSDYTAYMDEGEIIEFGPTETVFTNPREARTEAYVTRRAG
ncbi:MAG: phosphate ABC transporter ATP-binding protein [Gemmatimonadetes bacterium]|nr:phosphate ABC transporter ATP-binding protein [Gemmatimonadota bacterium]NNM32756.1 phosphate ABC transporter ATP-binding protein [Gemmatimonadota bacterium]